MKVPVWVADLAAEFWSRAGEMESFPRNLRQPIARAVPLTVALVPHLSLSAALDWLEKQVGLVCNIDTLDRPMSGCLFASKGHGVAFVNGADAEEEQRFSLAHELAHFLRDYWRPRQRTVRSLGQQATEVLDGLRTPTEEERLGALLSALPSGYYVHLLERDRQGNPTCPDVLDAETSADRLAYELLAPTEHLAAFGHDDGPREWLVECLRQHYGFPARQANRYAEILLPVRPVDPLLLSLRESLHGQPSFPLVVGKESSRGG